MTHAPLPLALGMSLVLALVAGCDIAGTVPDDDSAGDHCCCDDDGDDDTVVETSSATVTYRWVDRNGDPVTSSPALIHLDIHGYQWEIDPDTGRPVDATAAYLYESDDCSGPALVAAQLPRVPIETPDGWHVRGDDQLSVEVCVRSSFDGDGCDQVDESCGRYLDVDDLVEMDPDGPSTARFEAPLRREILDPIGY